MQRILVRAKFLLAVFFILCHSTFAVHGDNSPPVVEISNGRLQGTLQKSYNGRIYSSFQGIPYARPPIGDLRFEAPKEPYNWTGTWIANTKYSCMYNTGSQITGDEDCLYLNVYVPRETPDPTDNLNIIVHIHAGGMLVWDSTFYAGAKYLMDEEAILVTMNYRLGALGFLSTDDDVVPGNNGLKDQVLSLEWIQKNIRYFGGNPGSVMLTGMSAGSVSVHLHYFSPLSRGLFHKGVSQSGTALHPLIPQKSASQSAKQLGEMLGCPTDNSKHLRDCLRTRSAKTIITSQKSFLPSDASPGPTFGPVIEIPHDEAFLTEHPYKLLTDKNIADVPWIVGTNEEEGSFVVHLLPLSVSDVFEMFDEIAPEMLDYQNAPDNEKQKITNRIKKYYFKEHGNEDISGLIQLFTDRVIAGTHTAAKLQAKVNKSPVYSYLFGYRGQHSFADYLLQETDHIGPTHGDDVLYYLHGSIAEETLSEEDESMKSIFLQWLINYAKTDEPKIDGKEWKRVNGDIVALECLYFDKTGDIHSQIVEDLGANELWSKLSISGYEKFRIKDEL